MFYFCFLSFQQARLRCLHPIPQASDGLGMTKAYRPSPGSAHKMDSPHQESSHCHKKQACKSLYQIYLLLYKSKISIKHSSFQCPGWGRMCLRNGSMMCRLTSQLTEVSRSIPWSLIDKLHFCKVVFRLAQYGLQRMTTADLKNEFIYFPPLPPLGHGTEPKYTPQTALNYQHDC